MMKHIPVLKNTTGNHEQDAEEESSASEGERETDSRETYWKDTRHAECPGRYRNCNGKEDNGRNSTEYMGTSPMMPVTRET